MDIVKEEDNVAILERRGRQKVEKDEHCRVECEDRNK